MAILRGDSMPTTRSGKTRESPAEAGSRGILAHMEHLKAVGQALTKAADTYIAAHRASDLEGDWRDDLDQNLAKASRELHRTLSAGSRKVVDVYFGEEDLDEPAIGSKVTLPDEPV